MATFWEKPPPHTPQRCREDVEADVRQLMSKHAAIKDRGFDTRAQREILHRRIDKHLDEYALYAAVEDMVGGL